MAAGRSIRCERPVRRNTAVIRSRRRYIPDTRRALDGNPRSIPSPLVDTVLYTGASPRGDAGERGRKAGSLAEQVYADLQYRLMMGDFGAQTRIREERLAAELGVSRTPVREALIRLTVDGLLVRMDSGYYPVLPDLSELRDLYELRITIELRGLARALESGSIVHDAGLLEPLLHGWRDLREDPP